MTRCMIAAAVAAAIAIGCRGQTVGGRSRFVEDGVGQQAPADWTGERVDITNEGVTPGGGIAISAPGTGRISSVARMLAIADTTDKPNADRAILSATKTYSIATKDNVTTVTCKHGETFASAADVDSGCDALDIAVPSGTLDKRLSVSLKSGNGKVVAALAGTTIATIDLHGLHGTLEVATPTTQGATITIVSETGDDITLRLPHDFAADKIVIDTAPDKIDTMAFADLQSGKPRGAPGAGAKLITISSGFPGGLRGRVLVVAQ